MSTVHSHGYPDKEEDEVGAVVLGEAQTLRLLDEVVVDLMRIGETSDHESLDDVACKLSSAGSAALHLDLLDILFVNWVREDLLECLYHLVDREDRIIVLDSLAHIFITQNSSSVFEEFNTTFAILKELGIAHLVTEVRECHDWDTGVDKLEGTSEAAMGETGTHSWVVE